MTINQKNRKIYYMPVTSGDFDYGLVNLDVGNTNKKTNGSEKKKRSNAYMVTYDLISGKRDYLGILKPTDGSFARGMDAAETDKDGKVWFVGAFEQSDEVIKVNGGFRNAMGLGCFDPFVK
jgi:hypothetical protein